MLDFERRDWDYDKLTGYFNPADAEAIAKIKIPTRHAEDFLAWPMEKSGLFTVRSAYNLALAQQNLLSCNAMSSAPDGERKLWYHVWKGKVPPKVNVFIWKLCRDALPTQRRKFVQHMEIDDTCRLCGMASETGHHATVVCPQARDLRSAMRGHWPLPDEEQFTYSGPDWLLLLLDRCSLDQRDMVKLVLWRAWTSHNNIVHQSGSFHIESSVHQLLNIREITMDIKAQVSHQTESRKGKEVHADSNAMNEASKLTEISQRSWVPPREGWIKVNVDGSFVEQTGGAGVGVIARDHKGVVLFTAWRVIFRCTDALEVEALACVEGFRLASQWAQGSIILETDCVQMVKALQGLEDRPEISFIIAEAKEIAQLLNS